MIAAIEGSSVVFYMDDSNLQRDDIYNCYMIIVQGNRSLMAVQKFNLAKLFFALKFCAGSDDCVHCEFSFRCKKCH